MNRLTLVRISGAVVIAAVLFVGVRLTAEQVAQQPLEAIVARIPEAWHEGGWDELAALQAIIAAHPTDAGLCARAQDYVGAQYYANRDHQRAIQAFQEVIERYPSAWLECQKAQFEIGQMCLYRLDDPARAVGAYEQVIRGYPRSFMSARAQLMLGRTYRRLRDGQRARQAYEDVAGRYAEYPYEITEAEIDLADLLIEQALAAGDPADVDASLRASLSALKRAYRTCPVEKVEFMRQVLDGVYRAFRALDGNAARGTAFIKYQRYGRPGEDGVIGSADDVDDPLKEF